MKLSLKQIFKYAFILGLVIGLVVLSHIL